MGLTLMMISGRSLRLRQAVASYHYWNTGTVVFAPCYFRLFSFVNGFAPALIFTDIVVLKEEKNKDIRICSDLNAPTDNEGGRGENKMGTNIFLYVVIKDSNDDISANISK